jgi:hypothetical protein
VEKAHGIAQAILNEHAVGVARDQARNRSLVLVGQRDRGWLMPQVLHEDLAEPMPRQFDPLFLNARRAVLAGGHVQLLLPPRRAGQRIHRQNRMLQYLSSNSFPLANEVFYSS